MPDPLPPPGGTPPPPKKRRRRARKPPVFLSPEEADRLLACARCPRDRVLFAVMLLAGLRVAEACALAVEDLDLAAGTLLVRHGKGDKSRLLPLAPRLAAVLAAWVGTRTGGVLFRSPARLDRPLTTRAVRYAVEAAARRAGITRPDPLQRVSPHKLRHTFATTLLSRNVDLVQVRDLMGHRDLATTSIYLHTTVEMLRSAVGRL